MRGDEPDHDGTGRGGIDRGGTDRNETSLRIELCPNSGRIRVTRTTGLGTYVRTIDR